MKQLTVRHTVMISEQQSRSLDTLKDYNVNVSQFIRSAIKEKLQRDWKGINEKQQRCKCPF